MAGNNDEKEPSVAVTNKQKKKQTTKERWMDGKSLIIHISSTPNQIGKNNKYTIMYKYAHRNKGNPPSFLYKWNVPKSNCNCNYKLFTKFCANLYCAGRKA